jgi:hypothetical protein
MERAPGTQCTAGWMGLRAGLDIRGLRRNLLPLLGIEHGCPVCCKTLHGLSYLNGRDYLEDLGVDGRIILKPILTKIQWENVDWKHMAQNTNQWQDRFNMVTNLQIP